MHSTIGPNHNTVTYLVPVPDPEREAVVLPPRLGHVRPEVLLAAVRRAAPGAPQIGLPEAEEASPAAAVLPSSLGRVVHVSFDFLC